MLIKRSIQEKIQLFIISLIYAIFQKKNEGSIQSLIQTITKWIKRSSSHSLCIETLLMFILLLFLKRLNRFRKDLFKLDFSSFKDIIGSNAVMIGKKIPIIKSKVDAEYDKIQKELESSLKDNTQSKIYKLPIEGLNHEEVLQTLESCYQKEKKVWEEGNVSGAVYHGNDQHLSVQNKALQLFSLTNPLHPDMWPSLMKFESEVIQMTVSLLNGGCSTVCGAMSFGGTESIVLATKTHREWAYQTKGITEPEIVAPITAHPAINKACELLKIKLISVPVDKNTFKVDSKVVSKHITSNTIMLYGSAPNYPQGIIDPISDLSKLAQYYDIGLHVDCCLGGFILPFGRKLGFYFPEFNFALTGVTSMSVDTHKYGYSVKGTSVVLYRSKELRHYQYFSYPSWPGGLYVTPTIAGSRPGALNVACWCSLVCMGEKGYMDCTKGILELQRNIKKGVQQCEGIELLGDPISMIVAFRSSKFNIYNLAAHMKKRGWFLNCLQNPPSVHICITYPMVTSNSGSKFLHDLNECVKYCLENTDEEQKDAAIYGMASSMPGGPVKDVLNIYTDITLSL